MTRFEFLKVHSGCLEEKRDQWIVEKGSVVL